MSNQGNALCQKVTGSYEKFSQIAVRSSGTLGKGRKPSFTVYGGSLSSSAFLSLLSLLLIN
jgi:hypothetical protein